MDDYFKAEIIPVTKKNYRKIQNLTYKRLLYPPLFLFLLLFFFVGPFLLLHLVANLSGIYSAIYAVFSVGCIAGLGPLLQIKVTYWMAKKDNQKGFRKFGYLKDFDIN